MTIIERIEQVGFQNILRAYGFHSEVINRNYSADTRIRALDEYIAANERLKGQDEYRRALINKVNLILMEDILVVMDEAQDKFEESVAAGPFDWDAFALALVLYYGAMIAIASHQSSYRHDAEVLRMFRRTLEIDWTFFKKWKQIGNEGSSEFSWINRGKLYGGNARGTTFDAIEDAVLVRGESNLVVRYVSRGDKNTCIPCKAAEGYYLLTTGPFPGIVCKGKARCRCRRIIEHNPEMYAKLTREPVNVGYEREF